MGNNVIAIVNYNQKKYRICNENNTINYAVLDDEKSDIDAEAIDVLNKVYNLISYDKDYSVFCGNYKLNNNEFGIYQDLRSKLYTFVLNRDGKKYVPSEEDTIVLNSYFNDEHFVFYNENGQKIKGNNKTRKFIKKVLTIGAITVAVLISATVLTYNLPQETKANIDYKIGTTFRKDLTQEDKSFTFEDVKAAIDSNDNIPEEDKKFIKGMLEAEFEENKEYMDIPMIIRKIKTLKLEYDRYYTYNEKTGEYEITHGKDVRSSTSAYYNSLNNKITFLESYYGKSKIEDKKDEDFGFNEVDKSTYYHELNHMFTFEFLDSSLSHLAEGMEFIEVNDYIRTNTGIFEAISDDIQKICNTSIFRETINEIFSQEYVDKYYKLYPNQKRGIGYRENLPYMYCLAEILPAEVLREYKFNDNDSIITEALLKISDNKSEVYRFITSLKSIGLYSDLVLRAETNNNIDEFFENRGSFLEDLMHPKEDSEEVKQAKLEEKENYKRIHDGFAYFYKAKYGKEMSDDMNMLLYLYNTPVLTDKERQKVVRFLHLATEDFPIKVDAKGYFSKDYIENHPYVEVTFTDKDLNKKTVTIDDNNRYLENGQSIER